MTSTGSFQTYSAYTTSSGDLVSGPGGVQFSYSAADNRYTIALPGRDPGQLTTTSYDGSASGGVWTSVSASNNELSGSPGLLLKLAWPPTTGLKYTGYGWWFPSAVSPNTSGTFAYGISTAAGDVPLSGTASYAGNVEGLTRTGDFVNGTVSLNFDFGAGTLSGQMKPWYAPVWDGIDLGTYTFKNTVYSPGSTSFSGSFDIAGTTAPSSFQGSFNGPQAAELMASWNAPYLDAVTNKWDTMAGIWTAKKP